MSEPSSADRDPFEVVAESFLARFRSGQRPSIDEYAARHPELADQIRELLPALVMVEQDLTIDRDSVPIGSRPPLPPAPFKERRLGDYRILREVGRGGMGVVYEAEQVSLGRRVALKVLPGHHSGDRTGLERFRREAKAAARLHHTNIVPVFEVGSDGDVAYYAMQFIQGQGLDQVIDELIRLRDHAPSPAATKTPGPTEFVAATGTAERAVGRIAESLLLGRIATEVAAPIADPSTADPEVTERIDRDATHSPGLALASRGPSRPLAGATSGARALLPGGSEVSTTYLSGRRATFFRSVAGIGRQAAQGLAYAHAGGIVHRDIKPSNLLLDHAGVVWIADFGLAKADDDGLTQSGDILGTLRYMAPERFRGAGDARADIYALGMTLYELLTLRPAYESADRLKLIERIKNDEPVRPRLIDPRIPRDLETIVLKAMDKLPERRYATAEALSEDLRRFLADEPIKARQISTSERYWRWARRNPVVATLGGVLSAVLVMATIGSLLTAAGFASLADDARKSALAERSAHRDADRQREAADSARIVAQKAEDEMRKFAAVAEARKLVAERESRRAEGEKKRAEEQLARSEELVYAGKLMLAQNDFEAGNGGLALHYLDECQAGLRGWEFRHLWGRINSRQTLVGHTGVVHRAAFSPDGSRIATGSGDGTARVWDAATAEPLLTLKGHRGDVLSVAFSPDGKRLVTAGGEWSPGKTPGDVKVWDVETGRQLLALEGHSCTVFSAAFSPDGSRILTGAAPWGYGPGEAKIWDAATGRDLSTLNGYSGAARTVAYSPDGRRLVVGGNSETASVRDASTGQKLLVLRNRGTFRSLAFSPDGRRIVAGLDDGMTKVWDADTGRELLALKGRGPWVNGAAFSPDGRRIVTGSEGQTASVWDAETGQELFDLKGHSGEVKSVSFSPDGRRVLTGSADGTAKVWDAETGQQVPVLRGHGDFVSSIAFSPDSGRIVTASGDGTARIWDAATARQLLVLKPPGATRSDTLRRLYAAAFSPDGRRIVAGGGDGTARVWDASTGQLLLGLEHSDGVACVAFRPDGRRIVTGTNAYGSKKSGDVKVWDAATGRELLTLQSHGPGVLGVKFSPDGLRILTGSQDGTAKVWDAATGRELLVLEGHAGALTSVAFRRDGRRILTGSQDHTARVWDAATGRELLSLRGHTAEVHGVAFSPDGDRIVTASSDRSAKVWDAETGQELLAFKGQPEAVWSVAFSPDGQRIVTGLASANATASIWYAGRGQDVLVLKGQGEPLSSVAFSPDGQRIFAWDTQKRVMAWSAADGRPIEPRNPPPMPPPGPARSADGFLTARPEGKAIVVTDKRPSPRENTWPLPDATERERHRVELARSLRRGEIAQAQILLDSGAAAFREGRLADANVRLQQASERLRALREEFPDDPLLAPMLGISHGFLASTLRDLKRPGDALAHARESLSIFESIHDASPNDLFNMACGCAMLSALEDRASPADREKLQARGVDYLRRAVEGDRTRIPPLIPADRDLDPLRSRADFRALMADLAFPRDPFRQPSPLALFESFSSEEKRELDGLSAKIALEPSAFLAWRSRGGFLARRGAWPAAAADYRRALDLNPPSKWADSNFDDVFALESAVVLLKSGDVDGYRRLARTMLDRFAESNIATIADVTAKVNSLLPPPEQDLGRLGRVAQHAVDAGRVDGILPWCLLVRGMAAYRAGDLAGAVEWLDKAGASSPGSDHRAATKSYQAMAAFRLGRVEQARALLSEAGRLTASRVAQKDVGGGWHDLWIAELARREAEPLVNSTQPQTAGPVGP